MNVDDLTGNLVDTATRTLRILRQDSCRLATAPISPALSIVAEHEPVTVSEFARRYGCTQPAASQMLAKLEKHGWVERTRSHADRRVSTFHITATGTAHMRDTREHAAHLLSPAFTSLTPDQRDALSEAITVLNTHLDTLTAEVSA